MVNWDLLSLAFFFLLLLFVYYLYKNRFETQGLFVMYKTQIGIRLMDTMAKKAPRLWKFLSVFGVFVGFFEIAFCSRNRTCTCTSASRDCYCRSTCTFFLALDSCNFCCSSYS